MTINWYKTKDKYDYDESSITKYLLVIVNCDICHKEYTRQFDSYRRSIRKNGKFICHNCIVSSKEYKKGCSIRTKKQWENEETRKNLHKSFSSKSYRDKMAKITKELWKNEEYVTNIKNIYASEEYKKNKSKERKILWTQPEFRDKMAVHREKNKHIMSIMAKIRCNTPEYKKLASERSKELWTNKNFKIKVSEGNKRIWKDKLYKEKMSRKSMRLWQNSEYRKKQAAIRANQPRVSNIQKILYSILDDLAVKYYREYNDREDDLETVIGPYNFDCVIPREDRPDLLIECQGDYWHSLDKTIRNDKSKATYIERYYSNKYELKYLWEHEFYCKDKISELLKYWLNINRFEIIDYNFGDVRISDECSPDDYKLLLGKYHYLSNAGRGGRVYGAYLNNQLIATCIFSPLVRQNIKTNNFDPKECLELSRFCIHPKYQKKNFGSWFISKCLKLLDKKYKLIISYCDTTYNHDGALYKACNFRCDGIVKPDYWYVSENGWVMHKKTLYNRAVKMKMKESEFADNYNYKKVFGMEKLRFIYEL